MNHYVPDFEMDDDYAFPTSSCLTRPKKSAMADDEIMELLWQNGQVVMQSQTQQRSLKKPATPPPPPPHSKYDDAVLPTDHPSREIRPGPPGQPHQQQLFMQEDEMASWLHYPLNEANFDQDICAADLLFPPPPSTTSAAAAPCITTATASNFRCLEGHDPRAVSTSASRPPIPPSRRPEVVQNFSLFSRHKGAPAAAPPRESSESVPSNLRSAVARESTVVDSSDTPTPAAVASEARTPGAKAHGAARSTTAGASSGGGDNACGAVRCAVLAGTSSAPAIRASNINTTATTNNKTNTKNNNKHSREMGMTSCDTTATSSSPGGSSASAEPPPASQKPTPPEDRKRKGKDEDADWHSEDAEFECGDAKKQARRSTSTRRSRAAEVHNLSERRRRDRINEKMRALQELIPRCNKSDKASMLDEAIEYLKSLQLQVQMMSMGCGMVPMMFPGVQQYMPPMGMGMGVGMGVGMGMGMGMDMSMSRPMMPFPNVLAGAPMPTPATAVHLGPRFPMPAFHMPPAAAAVASVPDPSRIQAANQSDPMLSPLGAQNPNQPRIPNFADSYQQLLSLHRMQLPIPQNQVVAQPGASNPSASRGAENLENNQSGT